MTEHAYIEFLIGRNGEFDEYAASLIRRVRKAEKNEWCDITLVLPYTVTDIDTKETWDIPGKILVEEGLTVTITGKRESKILLYTVKK